MRPCRGPNGDAPTYRPPVWSQVRAVRHSRAWRQRAPANTTAENWTLLTPSVQRSAPRRTDGCQVMRGTRLVAHVAMRLVSAISPPPAVTSERADRSSIQDVVEPGSGDPQPDLAIGPRTRLPRAHLRWLPAVLLLCGIARPAFADGALLTTREIYGFLAIVAVLILLAIVVLVLVIRAISNALQRREDRRAESADPVVPAARVVQDRSRPS